MRTLIDFGCGVSLLAAIYLAGNYILYQIIVSDFITLYLVVTIITFIFLGILAAGKKMWGTFAWMPLLLVTHPVGTSIYWFAYLRKKVLE